MQNTSLQVVYYQCISLLHMGMLAEENQKMGERVTYYQVPSSILPIERDGIFVIVNIHCILGHIVSTSVSGPDPRDRY